MVTNFNLSFALEISINDYNYYGDTMNIEKIVNELEKGNLVITPTDTIYGIMGDATNEKTINKIYQIKNRPFNKPLIILMDSYNMIKEYTKNITTEEEILIKEFMPGLVTIILEKNEKINNLITANTSYVGIRIPDNQELLEIIKKLGRPIISTSANISDEEVITNIKQLDEKLKNNISYIYDGGEIKSRSSIIVKFDNHKIIILRKGILTNKLKEKFK